jgi:ATP/maltotriose-dependent transcriptional regulator MalT
MERDGEEHLSEQEKEELEELEEEAAERNPDPVTRREALELDLMEEGMSEAGEEIGDELD